MGKIFNLDERLLVNGYDFGVRFFSTIFFIGVSDVCPQIVS